MVTTDTTELEPIQYIYDIVTMYNTAYIHDDDIKSQLPYVSYRKVSNHTHLMANYLCLRGKDFQNFSWKNLIKD